MKLKQTLFVLIALLPFAAFAQSSLTIFSEDGYKFYLILNGQRQNNVAMTNVRIDGLSQPQYAVKIIFDDKAKPEISKNIPTTDPATNAFADVTYKIKTTKDGELKMRYFSATPVEPNYVAPADVYVMHYGQPAPPPPPPGGGTTTVTQTTVTTSDGMSGGVGANINVGGPGVNMNINISDPNMGSSTTTTTRTTTTRTSSSYSDGGSYNDAPPPPPPPSRGNGCRYAMDANSFRSAKETITKASFEDTKLSTSKSVLASNCMNTDQIMAVCKLFSFEASKLDFAKYAHSRCTDPGNYFKVGNVFSFDASRTELNEYISGQ